LSFLVDAVVGVVDWIGEGFKDVFEFAVDEIVKPVIEFTGEFAEGMTENPIATLAKIVAISTGNAWAIPLIDGAQVAADGGSLGDVIKTVAVSYVAGKVGGEVAQHTAPFVDSIVGEALSEGAKEVAVQAITSGTVEAAKAVIYGEDPLDAFVRGGVTAAVSAGIGKISEQVGWEVEVTDPSTGVTSTRMLPNVVQNMVGTALAAELTGQDITAEMMANALSRGVLTTQFVSDYIVTNPNVTDSQMGFITAAFQRTAAVALSGGSGQEAFEQVMAVISAYGMSELHEVINDSSIGDFVGDTIDKISGDYQEAARLAALLDETVPRYKSNIAEYEEKYEEVQAAWENLQNARLREINSIDDFESGEVDPSVAAGIEADIRDAQDQYDKLVTDEGYGDRLKELEQMIRDDTPLITQYTDALVEAQNSLQVNADRLDGEVVSIYETANEYLVSGMDPGFNAEEYKQLNNIPDDVDPYEHFLANGQHTDTVYTSREQYENATNRLLNSALNSIVWDGFGTANNSLGRNLSPSDIQSLMQLVASGEYNSPTALTELLSSPEKQKALFNEWVQTIGTSPDNQYQTGNALTANDIILLEQSGYSTDGVEAGAEMLAEQAIALNQIYSEVDGQRKNGFIELGEGVTAGDVVSGAAIVQFTEDGLQWQIPETLQRWDSQAGLITQELASNQDGGAAFVWVDKDGTVDPTIQNLQTLAVFGTDTLSVEQQVELGVAAIGEGFTWDEVQEDLGWGDTFVSMAQDVLDWASSTDTTVNIGIGEFDVQNFLANSLKAGGGMLDAFNGMSTLFGIAPSDTTLGKFAQQLQDIGAAGNTTIYKDELNKLNELMNAPSKLPVDENGNITAEWYDIAFEKVVTIAGAASEQPSAFISEYIGVEALQELVPLAIGGVVSLGAKGAALSLGGVLSARMAAGTALSAAAITDIAESYGGTASETYDRSLEVYLNAVDPITGQFLYTEEQAKENAMTLAVQTGTVAAAATGVTLGIGGLSLEKAILGNANTTGFVGKGLDELATRIANGGTILIKEGLTEGVEEGLATAFREGHLHQIDPTIEVSREVAGSAFMGYLIGSSVAGGAYGVSQTGDMYSNFVSAIDPTINAAMDRVVNAAINYESTDAQLAASMGYDEYLDLQRSIAETEIDTTLDNLGVTNTTTRINVHSQANPDKYTNTAQVTTAFLVNNPEYKPTQADINAVVNQSVGTDANAVIDRYVDSRYVDTSEVINAAAEQGVTISETQAQEYVGQGPSGHEAEVFQQLEMDFGSGYTTESEVRGVFAAMGYEPTNEEVAAYVGAFSDADQETAITEYINSTRASNDSADDSTGNNDLGTNTDDENLGDSTGNNDLGTNTDDENLGDSTGNNDLGTNTDDENLDDTEDNMVDSVIDDLTAAIGAVASGDEAATGLYGYIDQAIADLEAAGLTSEQIQTTITDVVGKPSTDDSDATGIYATLEGLNNLSTDDVTTIVTEALSSLETISEDDVATIVNTIVGSPTTDDADATGIYATLENLENVSTDDVNTIVNTIVGSPTTDDADATGIYATLEGLNNVSTDDVNTIVTEALSGLENVSEDDVATIVNTIVGSPTTDDADATGIYATLEGLNNVSTDDVNTIVTEALSGLENVSEDDVTTIVNTIVGSPTTDDADATGIYAALEGLNDLGTDDVTTIVSEIVGSPATDDSEATGIYATIDGLNNISEEDVTTLVTEALSGLENISEEDVGNIVSSIVGNPATDDTDASGIYEYLDTKTNEVIEVLGSPADVDTEATGIYGYIDSALDQQTADLTDVINQQTETIASDVAELNTLLGQPAAEDADGNVTEATGVYARVQTLMGQGLTNEAAIAAVASELQVSVTALTDALDQQTKDLASDITDISDLLGQPATEDNPLTEEDESADPTGLFSTIADAEAAGQERDKAIDSAIEDLATQLDTTKDDIFDQLGLDLGQLETAIGDSQTAIENKIDKAVEDVGVDLGEVETEILEKMAEYEADGIDRDKALAKAISDVSTQIGKTETDVLGALASTETNILAELGTTETDILTALGETEAELSADIGAVSNLVGKPATEVTQTDIDFVVDYIAGNQVMQENQLAQYDVTGDAQVTIDDQIVLEQLLTGQPVTTPIATTSMYAPTGIYGAVQDIETDLINQLTQNQDQTMEQLTQNQDQTMDTVQQMEQNIVTNVEDEGMRNRLENFYMQALQAPDARGQQVSVKTPDPVNLDYVYDFESIFANPQQESMFTSPYAKGGQVANTTDKLLKVIGES